MQPYTGFAFVYDTFMDNVPYDEWADYVEHLLKKQGVDRGIVLDLGCGTGSMTRRLADKNYDMIGIDLSDEMLLIAREKNMDRENNILYLCQDMREFELYGTVNAVVSVCDSMNYILSEEELLQVLRLVNNYLDPGGVFIFDLDTRYLYEEVLGDSTIAENREEGSFIWENTYDADEMMNEIHLTLFLPEDGGEASPLFRKEEEVHYRRAYNPERIRELILEAGMEFIAVYDALTEEAPNEESERLYFIAKEKYQADKLYVGEG